MRYSEERPGDAVLPSLAAARSAVTKGDWSRKQAFRRDGWERPSSETIYETNGKACASLFPERSNSPWRQELSHQPAVSSTLTSSVSALETRVREWGRKHESEQEFCLRLVRGTSLKPPAIAKQVVKWNHDVPRAVLKAVPALSGHCHGCHAAKPSAPKSPFLLSYASWFYVHLFSCGEQQCAGTHLYFLSSRVN